MTDDPPTRRRRARADDATDRPGAELVLAAEPGATEGPGAEAPKGGILGAIRRHPTTWLISAGAVLFAGLGAGAVFTGVAMASADEPLVVASEVPAEPRPVPPTPAAAVELNTCSVADIAADGRLASLSAAVIDTADGRVLFDRGAGNPVPNASVLKTFTAAAAVSALGPDFRITTSVVDGGVPGSIVLVGRGDATLSALPPGAESVYAGAPKLSTLAAAALERYADLHPDVPIERVVLDASYWNAGDAWHESWSTRGLSEGYQSRVTALQVDGDRADPTTQSSPRSDDPIARAGEAFVAALRDADPGDLVADEVTTSTGTATGSTAVLAEVQSQPVSTLVKQMMLPSDNTLAEMLARIVSKHTGHDGSARSLGTVIPSTVSALGADISGMTVIDGSGLSPGNVMPELAVAQFMALVQEGQGPLGIVRDALSVSGQNGGLASRFTGDNAEARGAVRAKTGWIRTAYTLAGYLDAADGSRLAFAFAAVREGITADARDALDTLATAVYRCGSNLSNH